MEIYLALVSAILMALAAAGVVLFVKITRRRDATGMRSIGDAVPARPLSQQDAQRMKRRYWWAVGAVLGVLALAGLLIAG